MQDILVVVDMQNDFIDGTLGTKEAVAIVPKVEEKIRNFKGTVLFTRDTHETWYLDTQEGKKLPVPHCIRNTEGWQIRSELDKLRKTEPIDKDTFGSTDLADELVAMNIDDEIGSITFVGLCTDICVISNALLVKASLPEKDDLCLLCGKNVMKLLILETSSSAKSNIIQKEPHPLLQM